LRITIPNIAIPEVEYTFHCLLHEFLGLRYNLNVGKGVQDFIITKNGKSIVIKNHFFKSTNPNDWYQSQNIPQKVDSSTVFFDGKKMPLRSIFGKSKIEEENGNWTLESDIIASTFFMLTRWEEAIQPNRDAHGRFSAKDSLAFKNDFLHKPIVNEYVALLWILLKKIGVEQPRKIRNFKIVPTHDVDIPFLFPSAFRGIKSIARHLIKKESFGDGINYFKKYLKKQDAYDTHDLFLEGAEAIGEQAHFFFMSGGKNKYDPTSQITHPKVKSLIEKIKNRGHQIGFHPSYETPEHPEIFTKEKKLLEQVVEQKVSTGRQHYLRFDIPSTWNLWEKEKMTWDSSMGYSDANGFRCGVCYPFPIFDFRARKKLKLIERPLLLMEVTLGLYLNLSLEKAQQQTNELLDEVKKYNGEFIFLWHNSSIHFQKFAKYNPILFEFYKI